MLAYNTSPIFFFDALSNLHRMQLQQHREQLAAPRPKITKKVETEEGFQIQIHKASGNFNSYEVKVLKAYGNPRLVNIVIESSADEFSKVFQFSLEDIEVSEIDWEYYERENVLVLNIPKKVKFCTDDLANSVLCSLLGVPARRDICKGHDGTKKALREKRKEQKKQEKRAKRAEIEAGREASRLNAIRLAEVRHADEIREAELRRAEEFRAAELRRVERLRRLEEEKRKHHSRVAERARREENRREEAQKKDASRRDAEQKTESEREQMLKQQQEFLSQLFAGFLGTSAPFAQVFPTQKAQASEPKKQTQDRASAITPAASSTSATAATSKTVEQTHSIVQPTATPATIQEATPQQIEADEDFEDDVSTDCESILSDLESPSSPPKSILNKSPSLEEVEDEEFVMFRKKFGDQR